ncbi:protein FAM117B [Aplysia californica]|uniref:Protein FAM117B n=1 Tax=Aplysia californica TaxID=6500 RepID=A0ABM0JP52_APLCA|nr:protein FAM117B [Aplysia californica]
MMSNQTAQRVRRNGSPSTTKQGPIKAVQAFSLKQGNSSSKNASSSPSPRDSHKLWSRKSPDHRLSPERKSPGSSQPLSLSPNVNQQTQAHTHSHTLKEKGKNSKHSSGLGKWRPSSVDTVVPSYLTGQWPKDIIYNYHHYQSAGVFMCDKSTQTMDDWENKIEKKKKGHKRSASFGQGDQLKLQFFKQHLQKSKEGSKQGDCKQRSSPVPGNHSALSLTAPPALCSQTKTILISAGHIPRQNVNRFQRNSVEGLNTEIERLVSSVKAVSIVVPDGEEADLVFKEIPDGHRAPVPELSHLSSTRSVDTQTPSGHIDHSVVTLSRPASISPASAVTPPRPGSVEIHRHSSNRSESTESKSSSKGEVESSPEPTAHLCSPKLEKSCPFVREPPDGCEKVTAVEESRWPQIKEPMLCAPVMPNQFVFKQSQGSAFCPLIKSYLADNELSIAYNGASSPVLATGMEG